MTAQTRNSDQLFFDLSSRVKLRVSGADRLRFLNGQITNDIRKATEENAIEACVLNAKGKLDAHIFVHQQTESFLIDAHIALKPNLQARLERYVIADDVLIEDVSAQFSIFHVIATNAPALSNPAQIIGVDRFGDAGFDIWSDPSQRDPITDELAKQFKFCDENCAEQLRIEKGIPRWGHELTAEIIPVEANLEQRCISYEKGCYIGQETISRMKMSGQRNKQLCGLLSLTANALSPGMRLVAGSEPKDVGWITSTTRTGDREIALCYVKRGFNSVGDKLEALSNEGGCAAVQVVDLPFRQ